MSLRYYDNNDTVHNYVQQYDPTRDDYLIRNDETKTVQINTGESIHHVLANANTLDAHQFDDRVISLREYQGFKFYEFLWFDNSPIVNRFMIEVKVIGYGDD